VTPVCELCRKSPATQALSYSAKCGVVRKPVCDPCARALQLPHPFTLQPLDRAK